MREKLHIAQEEARLIRQEFQDFVQEKETASGAGQEEIVKLKAALDEKDAELKRIPVVARERMDKMKELFSKKVELPNKKNDEERKLREEAEEAL